MTRFLLALTIGASLAVQTWQGDFQAAEPVRYLRFQKGDTIAYGILEGDRVRQLSGNLFGNWSKTETTHALKEIKLLPPTQPTQVLALAGNYRSHLPDEKISPKFAIPQPFFKSPSCLVGHGDSDRKSTRLNSSHIPLSRMPSSA